MDIIIVNKAWHSYLYSYDIKYIRESFFEENILSISHTFNILIFLVEYIAQQSIYLVQNLAIIFASF